MLTLASKEKGVSSFVSVLEALGGRDYFCPECQAPVRKRQGKKQAHFYHYQESICKWSQVGWAHLKTQQALAKSLQGRIEQRFSLIDRVADLFCPSFSLVIEIQYSSLSLEEVLQRSWDYRSLGLDILWILQIDHPLEAEFALSGALFHLPHYFCDMKANSLQLFDHLGDLQLPLKGPALRLSSQKEPLSLQDFSDNKEGHALWQRYHLWSSGLHSDLLEQALHKTKQRRAPL